MSHAEEGRRQPPAGGQQLGTPLPGRAQTTLPLLVGRRRGGGSTGHNTNTNTTAATAADPHRPRRSFPSRGNPAPAPAPPHPGIPLAGAAASKARHPRTRPRSAAGRPRALPRMRPRGAWVRGRLRRRGPAGPGRAGLGKAPRGASGCEGGRVSVAGSVVRERSRCGGTSGCVSRAASPPLQTRRDRVQAAARRASQHPAQAGGGGGLASPTTGRPHHRQTAGGPHCAPGSAVPARGPVQCSAGGRGREAWRPQPPLPGTPVNNGGGGAVIRARNGLRALIEDEPRAW